MNLYLIFSLFILLIPAVYLAKQKNFLFLGNKENNNFLIGFIFLLPLFLAVYMPFYIFLGFLYFPSWGLSASVFWPVVLILSVPVSRLTIWLFKKYVLRTDPPYLPYEEQPESDLGIYDLYVFMPVRVEINSQSSYKKTGRFLSAKINKQVKEISANFSEMNHDILFTEHGELIVSAHALNVLKENDLTGYTTKPVIDKKSQRESNHYFQLVSNELQPLASDTSFIKGEFGTFIIDEYHVFYDEIVVSMAADFNRTVEYVGANDGYPYCHQRLWIVKRKTRDVLISNLNKTKNDFIPILLISYKYEYQEPKKIKWI